MQRKFLIRWKYEYPKKPSVFGMWSIAGSNLKDSAWIHNKNPSYASIEVKDLVTREIKTVAQCKGSDFLNFQWIVASIVPSFKNSGSVTLSGTLIGLRILSRYKVAEIYQDGSSNIRNITENEKKIKFKTYGK